MPAPVRSVSDVRMTLSKRCEIALLDVREEDPHAQAHPLFAANFPLGRIEIDAYAKLPRRDVPIVLLDGGEGYAEIALRRLADLGYVSLSLLAGGLAGWREAGGELFRDVNVPSKAFGELVEAERHTPSLAAEEVKSLIDRHEDIVIVDARRFDEYNTMSIPTATSVPGAELVLRLPQLAPDPQTTVVVNCAGRTRSIIGAQSLINAGLPNRVVALRNGTIGWTLAGQQLEHGQQRRFGPVADGERLKAARAARAVANHAGVSRAALVDLAVWREQRERTTYFIDVRTAEEYEAGHLPGFRHVPGGQLVQETEMFVPVRGARIVVVDNDGVRANMTASWLAQMAWEVHVLDGLLSEDFSERGEWRAPLSDLPIVEPVDPATLAGWLTDGDTVVLDVSASTNYIKGHIPGAWFVLRSQLAQAITRIPQACCYVLTCATGNLAHFAAAELQGLVRSDVRVLEGGNPAWKAAGFDLEQGPVCMASPPIDRYRRPYEGTDNAREAMQDYLDWEYGLVRQLARDGTHHFRVI